MLFNDFWLLESRNADSETAGGPALLSINIFEHRLRGGSRGGRPDTQSSCHRGLALAPPWSNFATFGLPRSTFRFQTSIFWLPTSFSQSQRLFSSCGSPSGGEFDHQITNLSLHFPHSSAHFLDSDVHFPDSSLHSSASSPKA